MKKIHLLCAAVILAASVPVFAQQQAPKNDLFVKTVPVVKVYVHELGYKVLFVNSAQGVSSLYLPLTWFGKAGAKGLLVNEPLSIAPYFSIFWANGKFDHIVLHVPADPNSPVWGILETGEDMKSAFNVEEPQLTF